MSQPPPDQDRPPGQDRSPGQDQPPSRPAGNKPSIWPSGHEPLAWPSPGQPSWPSASQSSWPSAGQSPPPPPPAWPPAGQPPLSSPDYTYGYGPRLPRFLRRFPVRALLVLGLLIAFGFAVLGLTTHHKAAAVTPPPAASGGLRTGLQAPPGAVGASFGLDDGSGNRYQVTLVRVIDPARGADQFSTPGSGKRFVGLVFRIKAMAGRLPGEDANNDAVLVGTDGQDHPADLSRIAGYANFDDGAIHLAPGETVTGAVAFQVPDGVAVSRVQWTALSGFGSMVEWNVRGQPGGG